MILRDYQQEAVQAIYDYWDKGKGTNCLVVAPTGSGKSIIIAEFCRRTCIEWKGVRIICVTDSRELIRQNEQELRDHWPDASTGIYSAGLNKKQTQAQITFAGIQSIYKNGFDLGKIDIVLIDEAHMIPRDSETRYGEFITNMKTANPKVVVVGFTATPFRLDSGLLHEGDGALFDGIAYSVDMKSLIANGYLVPVVSKGGVKKINLAGVKLQAGDYKPNELANAADDPALVKSAVAEIIEYGHYRKSWLVFCCSVAHAEHVAAELRVWGIQCEVVTGETPTEDRDKTIERFKSGALRCMVNVMVFTKGFNAPRCDLIALLMATKSTGKYVQVVGRGMRTYEGKEDCLLLDFGNNVVEHGPIDEVNPIIRRNILGEPIKASPMKECPQCHAMLNINLLTCACGHVFDKHEHNHTGEAYGGAVLSGQPTIINVSDFWVTRHKKQGKPDSVKVTFFDKLNKEYAIWLALDHGGYATDKALPIVRQFGGKATSVDQALQEWTYWKKPIRISIKQEGKFIRVIGIKFADDNSKQTKFGV